MGENNRGSTNETEKRFSIFDFQGKKYIRLDIIPRSGQLVCDGRQHYMKEGDNLRLLFVCEESAHKKALQEATTQEKK